MPHPDCGTFRGAEDYRDHLPCEKCEPTMTAAQRREQRISWVWGNLNASSNHKVSRELVERVVDELEKESKR